MAIKNILRTFVLLLVLVFETGTVCADPSLGPPPGADWVLIPGLTDEFEGNTLDSDKWYDYNPGWTGRSPSRFARKNVSVSDGKLHLKCTVAETPTTDHQWDTAAVKSKAKNAVKYGYFEIKCRPMKSEASSAFWFYKADNPRTYWDELDVFEIAGVGKSSQKVWTTVHLFPP